MLLGKEAQGRAQEDLNIRSGTLEDFDARFFKDEESCPEFLMDLLDYEEK
jgi:hypothetical protein